VLGLARSSLLLGVLGIADPAAAQGTPWKLLLAVSESYHTNVRLTAPAVDAFATRITARLSKGFQGPRWNFNMGANLQKAYFHGRATPRPTGIFYGVSAQFGYQISERASFSIEDRLRSAYTGEMLEFLEFEDDVVLPLNRQKRNHLRGSLGIALSPTLSFAIPVVYDTAIFSQDDALQPRLVNGDRFATGMGFSKKMSDETTASLNYTYALSDQRIERVESHSLALGVAHQLGEFTNFGVAIGGGIRETRLGGRRYVLSGGASIGRQFENFSLNLAYRRNLGALFGLGREVVHNSIRLSHHRPLTKTLAVNLSGAYVRTEDLIDPTFSYNAWFANVGFNQGLGRSFNLHAGYHFGKRSPLPGEFGRNFETHRVSAQLGWNTEF
jgi:hypothetical protein